MKKKKSFFLEHLNLFCWPYAYSHLYTPFNFSELVLCWRCACVYGANRWWKCQSSCLFGSIWNWVQKKREYRILSYTFVYSNECVCIEWRTPTDIWQRDLFYLTLISHHLGGLVKYVYYSHIICIFEESDSNSQFHSPFQIEWYE